MKIEVKIPVVGESIKEVYIAQWLKKTGDYIKVDEPVCQIESEKASMEVPAEAAGVLTITAAEGSTQNVGAIIAIIDTDAAQPSISDSPVTESGLDHKVRISPVAAKILADEQIPSAVIAGTGPAGRITKDDALKAIQNKGAAPAASGSADSPRPPTGPPAEIANRNEKHVKMTTLRKTIAKHLVAAKNQTAMLTTFNEIDMTAVKQAREKYKEAFLEKHQIKLGFMSFFARAVCLALQESPVINATIEDDDVVYHEYCDLSIAVSTARGLVTPVIKNAELMNLAQLEREIEKLAAKARDGKLTIAEMTGGTFTITNGGVFGSLMSTPIINIPQSAILGMHKIQERPMAINGQIAIRPMMYLALSYDHRLIDGRESVLFLVRIKDLLEDPLRMLLEV